MCAEIKKQYQRGLKKKKKKESRGRQTHEQRRGRGKKKRIRFLNRTGALKFVHLFFFCVSLLSTPLLFHAPSLNIKKRGGVRFLFFFCFSCGFGVLQGSFSSSSLWLEERWSDMTLRRLPAQKLPFRHGKKKKKKKCLACIVDGRQQSQKKPAAS